MPGKSLEDMNQVFGDDIHTHPKVVEGSHGSGTHSEDEKA